MSPFQSIGSRKCFSSSPSGAGSVTTVTTTVLTTVLFDFDGTLANSLELGYEIMEQVCAKSGFKILPKEDYRNLGTRMVIRKMGIPIWLLPRLMREGRKLIASRICEATPVENIDALLLELSKLDLTLAIVTSNAAENVKKWLEFYELDEYFQLILGGGGLLKKERCIKKCLKSLKQSPDRVVYIGDEARDILACHRLGVRAVGATWGLDLPNKLAKAAPYVTIDQPLELAELVKAWHNT